MTATTGARGLSAAFGLGLGDAAGVALGFAEGVAVGFADGAALGAPECKGVGEAVGTTVDVADGDGLAVDTAGCTGAFVALTASAFRVAFGAPADPPKKCANTPPKSRPAKITMTTSGNSGKPPLPFESSSERRRRGASLT
ncbi:MAG: hypothetical protein JOY69_03655 [Candidatus Eremiobacteraeota bacterium]|nr:hypothetical protein [Candidatus Eremiobacteraeota bacterium]